MAQTPWIYAPSELVLLIAGIYEITGYSTDEAISISKNSPYFSTNVGSSGTVERIHNPDRTYTLTISLSQTSPSNSILTALANLDDATKSIPFPIYAKDNSGQSIFTAAWCYIESPPAMTFTDGIETRVWTIQCTKTFFGLAGNTTEENILDQAAQLSSLLTQFSVQLGGIF